MVRRHYGPSVVQDAYVVVPGGDHGLDADRHALHQSGVAAGAVAWIHRAVLNSKKLKSFFRKNQKVLTADTSETKRLKNIRTMIGL